ncbi:MAG: ATP-dependent metallopeptidase FtsH/Yme1/Tma family protein, partial [Rhizobiales bacterium]|nr:ATP-dependent metallopeptidase FtsH/Yme1/Tma family protein [Hyphomicrobiales bacterium]
MREIRRVRGSFIWLAVIVAVVALWFIVVNNDSSTRTVAFSDVVTEIQSGKVSRLTQTEGSQTVHVDFKDATTHAVKTRLPSNTNLIDALHFYGIDPNTVQIDAKAASKWGGWLSALGFLLPTLFLVGIFIFMMRQAQGSNNQAMSFGKSRARLFTGNKPTVTFSDVAGVDEAKEELVEVVEFLKY